MQPDLSLEPEGAAVAARAADRLAADLGELHRRIERLALPPELPETVARAAAELERAGEALRTMADGLRAADAGAARTLDAGAW